MTSQRSNMDKIAIIFSINAESNSESIKEFEGFKRRFCEVITDEDVKLNPGIFKEYSGMVDCTNNNIFYNMSLNKKTGIQYKVVDKEYIKTTTNKFIIKGPSLSQLTATNYSKSESIATLQEKAFEAFDSSVNFLYTLIRKINNILMYEQGIKTEGIVLNEILQNSNKRVYKLVREIPITKESGVTYITPDDIKILNEILNLKGVIS